MNIKLTEDEHRSLRDALIVAIEQYRRDAQMFVEHAKRQPQNLVVLRIGEQFHKQVRECEALLEKIT